MQRFSGPGFAFLVLLFTFNCIRLSFPQALEQGVIQDSSFSVHRAFAQVNVICAAPHMVGTPNHEKVKSYIMASLQQAGFSVEEQQALAVAEDWGSVKASYVKNIVAVKKGTENSRAVMLMAHYDSEPNTPGAGDDGAGVAAILENARALQHSVPLKNDLVVLITDGEEVGLMGARAFMKEHPLARQVGVILNFEGRGNSGPSNMFEVNEQNGWVAGEFAKAAAHPFANSLGYEVYKKLPNGTDYTIFKQAGIAGLNNAYIDGFVNYHSPTDRPENLDLRSLQHQGENMLSLVKHFGRLRITETKAPDISYFNAIGNWFIHYPASWNIFFVVIVNILLFIYLGTGFRKKEILAGHFGVSVVAFPLILALVYLLSRFVLSGILAAYPLYDRFDGNNSYNSGWYFLAMAALAVAVTSGAYYWLLKRVGSESLYAGILFFTTLLLNGMYLSVPTASYLLFVPLFFLIAGRIFIMRASSRSVHPMQQNWISLASSLPAISILAPTIYYTFIAFALAANMPLVTVIAALLAALLIPCYLTGYRNWKSFMPALAAGVFLFAICMGQVFSRYDKNHPLQTYVRYELDTDAGKANWVTDRQSMDAWTGKFFTHAFTEKEFGPPLLKNAVTAIPLTAPLASLVIDSLAGDDRMVELRMMPGRTGVVEIDASLSDSSQVHTITVNGDSFRASKNGKPGVYHFFRAISIPEGGINVRFIMPAGHKLEVDLVDRSIGLPSVHGYDTRYPDNVIPGANGWSNSTHVKKHFSF